MNSKLLAEKLLECSQAEIQEVNELIGDGLTLQSNEDPSQPVIGDDDGNDTHPKPPVNG